MSPAETRKEQAQKRRAQLVDVALELYVERGIENVAVGDVAARAGVAHGLVYHYFGSKDGLLAAVMERASPVSDFRALAAGMAGLPAAEGLRSFTRGLAALLDERRDVIRLLLREVLSPASTLPVEVAAVQATVLAELGDYLAERVTAGELRPHDTRAPFRMLISSALVLAVVDQPMRPWVDPLVDTVLNGILA